jgi:hypothetical protein
MPDFNMSGLSSYISFFTFDAIPPIRSRAVNSTGAAEIRIEYKTWNVFNKQLSEPAIGLLEFLGLFRIANS